MAAPPSPVPDDELLKMAEGKFAPLSNAEVKLLRAAPKGEVAVCGPNIDEDDPANDPSKADQWGPERTIRAEMLRWLCVDRHARELVDPKGIRVDAAKISGTLDLSFVAVPFPLGLFRCRLLEDANLMHAEIPALNLSGSRVRRLAADSARLKGGLFLRDGFHAEGEVQLLGAEIGGDLSCVRGTFKNPEQKDVPGSGKALSADGIKVTGSVFLRNGFSSEGEVRLLGAEIGGSLECDGSTFKNPAQKDVPGSGKALFADRIKVTGSVFLRNGFISDGEVRLLGAEIGGNLDCERGMFKNPAQKEVKGSGDALSADGMKVKGSVFLRNGFSAEGEVRLLGAEIGGNLDCVHGTFHNPAQKEVPGSGKALIADRIKVTGGVFLSDGFSAEGEVRLPGTEIGGDLACRGGGFTRITAQTAVIKGKLIWDSIVNTKNAELDLRNATADSILDDEASWPAEGKLFLTGFVYGRISQGPGTAEERLKWLARQVPFHPQPYRQLAKVLRENGDDAGPREVLYEMEDRIWKGKPGHLLRLLRWPLKGLIGYGRRPWRVMYSLAVLIVCGWLVYDRGYQAGAITPRDRDAHEYFQKHSRPPDYVPEFFPLVYSVENSFPLVKLWQADAWQPAALTPTPAVAGKSTFWRMFRWMAQYFHWSRMPLWFLWFQILAGWIVTTLFVTGFTGIIRHD